MPTVIAAGGSSIVLPLLEMDIDLEDPAAAEKLRGNWQELRDSFAAAGLNNGTVKLPAGIVDASYGSGQNQQPILALDDSHAGITIEGAGRAKTLLRDPLSSDPPIRFNSRAWTNTGDGSFVSGDNKIKEIADITQYSVGDVIYFWVSGSGERPERHRLIVVNVNAGAGEVTLDANIPASVNRFEHAKGAALSGTPVEGNTSVIVLDPDQIELFRVGDDVAIGDGPGYDEVYCEFLQVTQVDIQNARVHFTPPLRRNYLQNKASLVPPPHMADITIRGLSVRTSEANGTYFGFVRFGTRLRFEDFGLVTAATGQSAGINFTSNGRTTFTHCVFDAAFGFGLSQDQTVIDVLTGAFNTEEFCQDFDVVGMTTTGARGVFDSAPKSRRIHLTNCDIIGCGYLDQFNNPNSSVWFSDESRITNVRIIQPRLANALIYLNNDGISLTNVGSELPILVRGQRMVVTGQYLIGATATTGPYVSLKSLNSVDGTGDFLTPLQPYPGRLFDNLLDSNSWRLPVVAGADGRVVSNAASEVGLTVAARGDQTANLVEFQGLSNALFAVNKDGDVVSSRITTDTTAGALQGKLKVLDANNTPYYIRLYAS